MAHEFLASSRLPGGWERGTVGKKSEKSEGYGCPEKEYLSRTATHPRLGRLPDEETESRPGRETVKVP